MSVIVRAHTNIALIKYWGKKDVEYKIPYNSSLSCTLDQFYTDTSVEYDTSLSSDVFYLDGKEITGREKDRVVNFMDRLRANYKLPGYAYIRSTNHVPKAAGLASSASAFAALAVAATLPLNLSLEEQSRLARWGSGSASRSLFDGFAVWHRGHDHETSFATPLEMDAWDDFRMIVCMVSQAEKPFLSSDAMNETVNESVFYPAWVEQCERDLLVMTQAVRKHDIKTVGMLAQENALRMHASLMAIGKWYFEPKTIEIMNRVRTLQKTIPVYFTMDAGPNVKIMTTKKYVEHVMTYLSDIETVICKPGPGVLIYHAD